MSNARAEALDTNARASKAPGRPSTPSSVAEAEPSTATASKKAGGRGRVIAIVVAASLAVGGIAYYLHSLGYEETDDAQIDGDITNVSARITGVIAKVNVVDEQTVKAGDLLAEIDPRDLDALRAQAQASVEQAEAQLQAEDPSVPITEASNEAALASSSSDIASSRASLSAARKEVDQLTAQLAQAEATDRTAQLEKTRSENLIKQGVVSQADFDQRSNSAAGTAAAAEALKQSLAAASDRVAEQQAHLNASQTHLVEVRTNAPRQVATRKASVLMRKASLDFAKAQLAAADLNLGYTKVVASVAGIVGKKSVSLGDHVSPGQQLMAISRTDSLWVTANFRETQLRKIKPGQSVEIHVDAIDADLHGSVENIGGATGSRFSVLPPENASGNYVKVVQRVPVRIHLDPNQPGMDRLRPGMSVEPKVDLK